MGLLDDLRTDIGDDDNVPVALPASSGTVTLNGLLRDLRADIGDDSVFVDNVGAPEIWGAVIVTENVYEKQPTDVIMFVNTTVDGPTTIVLPVSPVVGQICVIKDAKGDANINYITVQPPTGIKIDGFDRFLLTQSKQAITLTWNGTEFSII